MEGVFSLGEEDMVGDAGIITKVEAFTKAIETSLLTGRDEVIGLKTMMLEMVTSEIHFRGGGEVRLIAPLDRRLWVLNGRSFIDAHYFMVNNSTTMGCVIFRVKNVWIGFMDNGFFSSKDLNFAQAYRVLGPVPIQEWADDQRNQFPERFSYVYHRPREPFEGWIRKNELKDIYGRGAGRNSQLVRMVKDFWRLCVIQRKAYFHGVFYDESICVQRR